VFSTDRSLRLAQTLTKQTPQKLRNNVQDQPMSPQQNDRIKRREFLQNQFLKAQNNVKKEIDSKLKQEIKEILQETCVKRPGFLYRSQK
jgi:hypothetical protein